MHPANADFTALLSTQSLLLLLVTIWYVSPSCCGRPGAADLLLPIYLWVCFDAFRGQRRTAMTIGTSTRFSIPLIARQPDWQSSVCV